ncbi:MAG: hypothetical protein CMM30_01375 [Rhodospirillaceae bacterium]|nr:hypothetical protein [Alphaproteobacteria bacterium]MBR71577.1 hypothetical protein [Rhodospirillaceae bacterium]|tara:strand:- start:884 stop:1168 length:285 start_codon:yes stop_codon:yes gene_type:complete
MSYVTVSNWNLESWDDSMLGIAQDKFVPMIQALGATTVSMVRTGDLSMMVVTHYPDGETAKIAAEKISEIRSEAAAEFSMSLVSVQAGEVLASG